MLVVSLATAGVDHISGNMSQVYNLEPPTKGQVVLHTSHGDIEVELWPNEAPKASSRRSELRTIKLFVFWVDKGVSGASETVVGAHCGVQLAELRPDSGRLC